MTVFSRALVKVSRWELPTSHNNRRAFSSPSLSPETNHELACDSGQDRSASRSLKDVAAPYGLLDQETEQSDFATQHSVGKLGATRALKQSGSNCNLSDLPSGAANVLAPASSSPGATLSCLNVGNNNEQLGSYCESSNVPAPSGPTNVLAPASPSPGATLSCLNVGNHNEQSGSLCKSSNVPAPSGPTNVLAPASPSPGATLSCLNVGNHNEQSGSLCKSTNVSAPSGPAFTLAASSTTGATLSCLNVGVLNERLGSNRESDWILAQRGQRAPSPKTRAAENGNNPISSQSSTNETARATLNAANAMSGCSASPTKNLDNKGATNYTNMSGKSASSAVKSYMGGTAASSTAKSVLTVHGGTAASSTLAQSNDSNSTVTVTGGITTASASSTRSHDSNSTVTVTGGITTASSTVTRSHDSNSTVTVTGGITTASSTRSLDSNSTVTVTGGMTTASSTRHDSNSTVSDTVTDGMTTAISNQSPVSTVVSGFPTSSGPDSGAPDNESDDSNSIDTLSRSKTNVKSSNCICKCHCDINSSNTSEANLNISVKLNRSGTSACSKSKSVRLGQATIRFFTHVMIYYLMLLIHSFKFGSSSPSSTLLKSEMHTSLCTNGLYEVSPLSFEANTTIKGSPSDSEINITMNSTGVTMSFITHVVVYYLMFFVYTLVKKAKESCVMFVRYLLNKTKSTPSNRSSKVLPPCNFCDRDITYSEILNQLEPPVYGTVSSQYIACDCKDSTATVDVEPCDNFNKPCPNAWFDFRSHEKNKSLLEYFDERAIRGMLFDTEITVPTAIELFDIPLPVSGSLLDVELLLHHLQDEYHFTLKCSDCGEILSAPIISGGGKAEEKLKGKTKKKKPSLGRKRKGKRKGANAATGDTDSIKLASADPHDESLLLEVDEEEVNEKVASNFISESDAMDHEDVVEYGAQVAPDSNNLDCTATASDSRAANNETVSVISKIKSCLKRIILSKSKNISDSDEIISTSSTGPGEEVPTKSKQAKYNATNKGKAAKRKYDSRNKGKRSKAKRNKAYENTTGGKAAITNATKTYFDKDEGKAARSKANKTYFDKDEGKAARSKANKTYFGKDEGKTARSKANKTYFDKDEGKATRSKANKTYFGKNEGKTARSKANKTYFGKDEGKTAKNTANKTYFGKDHGKAARRNANKTYSGSEKGRDAANFYSNSEKGRAARKAAAKAHALRAKRRIPRKRNAANTKAYLEGYMPFYRECEKLFIDFSSEKVIGNTRTLLNHTIPPELSHSYKSFENDIVKGRCRVSPPEEFRHISGMRNFRSATAHYKASLSRKILSAMEVVSVDDESWITIPGVSKKALKRKHFNPRYRASKILADLAWLKREQCITVLKIQLNRLSSYTDAIISKMEIQEKESDKKAALLGLQSHQKTSEPYITNVSYVDGQPYNYEAEVQKFEEGKALNKKSPSHITYKCNENCILPSTKEDLIKLKNLFDECAKLSNASPGEFRRFLTKFQWCTKWHEYPEREKNDLNPNRMYLFPVKHRSHPKNCYFSPETPNKDCSQQNTACRSQEVIMRKFMVHYANPRKFHSIISKAITAHKLMSDIDASSIMGDVEYLSKLVKIELQYDDSTVGFDTSSEAREWTADSIEEKLAETAIQGKTPRTTFSHKDIFDRNRHELPSVRCHSCNKLVTPKQSSIINLNTAKKLEYNPEKGLYPNRVFQQFHDFLVQKKIIKSPDIVDSDGNNDSNACGFENHPTKLLHGLSICNSCRISLNKGEIPANSMMNNMYTGETPEVLKVLNPIELMFVSKTKCFQTIIKPGPISCKLPKSERLSAIKGNMIHLPLSTSVTAEKLCKSATERLFEEAEDNVLLYGKPNKDREVWNHIVDRKKVLAALEWLCENNPNYKDIIVPNLAEDILPHVFGYECELCQLSFETAAERDHHSESCSSSHDSSDEHSKSNKRDEEYHSYPGENGKEFSANQPLPNSSQSMEFECELDSESDEYDEQIYDTDSELPSDEIVSESGVIHDSNRKSCATNSCIYCKKVFESESDYKAHENDCATDIKDSSRISSANGDSDISYTNIKEKPWIEQVPKESLNDGFRHFRTVGNEAKEAQAKDVFRMLNIGSDPIPYYEPNVDCESFPEQFPYGTGGRTALREKKLQDYAFEQTRLMTSDNYQRRNIQYLLNLVGQKEKRLIKEGIFSVQNKNFKSMSKKDINNGAKEENPELLKRITSVLRKLPTQREFWNDVRSKVEAMVFEFGPPTFWATFSPGEYDDQEMLDYLRERNSDLPGVKEMTVSQLVCKDPILACTYLQTKFDATLKFMLSDANPIGKIKHHFVRTEYQTRLMPHFHCFFWIEDAPIIGRDSEDTILNFIGKHVSCKLPNPNEDPLMYGLVKKYQLHHCNSYCLRKPKKGRGKARCKFGFPRAACINPILHGVASSIASHKTGTYQKRLYEVERKHNEKFINDYNPTLLYLWKGNVDIQFIGEESESLVEYISKYATKAPRSAISDFELDAIEVNNKSNFGKLFQLASKLMKDRELGAMEARNFLLSEKPVQTNASFMFINTVYASKRRSVLKSKKDLEPLPDDSKDIYYGDLIGTWYPKRPPYDRSNKNSNLKNMSLYEFAKTYERLGNAAAAQMKDKSKLLKLDGNAGFMKKRCTDPGKDTLVIYGPSHLDPIKDSESYYFAFLLLHKPFWHEHLLMGQSQSYQAEFERLKAELPAMAAHEKKFRMKKNFREAMENDADAQADQMCAESEDANESDPTNADSGPELFETVRKQTDIQTAEQLKEVVEGLSPDQLAVYELFVENVEHYYKHKSQSCYCGKFEPLRLFVSGFGGSGKSHLIRTLMAYQYIRSEVKKEPCHFLLGAPTGIASHNIGGMTLHSMWSLPVNHGKSKRNSNEEYRKLKSNQINNMRANYKHACGLIVDEVSMISNSMLMAINLRMNEVLGSKNHEAFGGMPTVIFGDLFQLEPVNGCQPFVPLSSGVAQKMFGGFPCAPNLWDVFKFRQLNTNHRQQGNENQKWRSLLDHARYGMLSASDIGYLNERMIDTSGCKLQGDYLDRYVTKFLECEMEGLGPVCLLPANKMVKEFNQAVMQKKGEVPETIKSFDTFSCRNEKLLSATKKILPDLESDKTGGLEAELDLAVNTRVMLRVNDKRTPGLVNGARGTVHEIIKKMTKTGLVATKIVVKFDGIDKVQTIERIERKFQVLPNCYVYRKMFPLINSYAMTIHKSQSLSLPCVFADLGDRIFADGMSYVALSRCLRHSGLYLLNFKPESVKASNKACKEYSRLIDKGSFKGNEGCKFRIKIERPWYTSFVQDKATKSTREKMKDTAAGKRKGRNAMPSAKKTKYNNKTDAKPGTESTHSSINENQPVPVNKTIKNTTQVPKKMEYDNFYDNRSNNNASSNIESEKPYLPDCMSKKNTKNEVVNEKPTSSKGNQSPGNSIVVINENFRPMNYVPVDEVWQRSICNAFGWNYRAPSRGRALNNLYGINCKTAPKTPTKIGDDGNCWFRAIALIATGDQENYIQVKNSVIEFMWANIEILQKTFEDVPYYGEIYNIRFSPHFAREVILFHSQPNEWVKNVVMEMTAVMLNTRFYLYYKGTKGRAGCWTSIESGSYPVWFRRDQIKNYPESVNRAIIPDLGEQSLYIYHKNRNHFETCHDIGLNIRPK